MTPADLRRAERLAPAIAAHMCRTVVADGVDRGVDGHGGGLRWDGEQRAGWSAAWRSRRSVVEGQPPDTVDGWAGWLAVHIARGML